MMVKASAASTLLFAAGLFFGLAGSLPAQAASQDDTSANSKTDSATEAKPVKQHAKKHTAARKPAPVASKSEETKKAPEKDVADASGGTTPAISDSVANARAQADAAPDSARTMSAKASTILQASADKPAEAQADDATVVATDQLNDVDRALQQETPSTQTVAMASAKPAEDAPAAAATNDSSTLDKTSLVGKVFIAFGALLTMASAARMFMA
jgi:hypothetical protein